MVDNYDGRVVAHWIPAFAGMTSVPHCASRPTGGKRATLYAFTVHRRYNPDGISQYFIVPGLLGVILQMTMTS